MSTSLEEDRWAHMTSTFSVMVPTSSTPSVGVHVDYYRPSKPGVRGISDCRVAVKWPAGTSKETMDRSHPVWKQLLTDLIHHYKQPVPWGIRFKPALESYLKDHGFSEAYRIKRLNGNSKKGEITEWKEEDVIAAERSTMYPDEVTNLPRWTFFEVINVIQGTDGSLVDFGISISQPLQEQIPQQPAHTTQMTSTERDVYALYDTIDDAAGRLGIKSLLLDWDGPRPEDDASAQAAIKDLFFRVHRVLSSKLRSTEQREYALDLCTAGTSAKKEQLPRYTYTVKIADEMTEAEMEELYEGRTPAMDYLKMSDELLEEFERGGLGAVTVREL
ncbi:uncharacterized protein MKK02DRAFT_42726 [Dioszegia hungarica]|uniref:Uncharacterized protein n=1 Tax=Dioszegia hungarica TaxID=4972 RepID=A0AA38LWI2_9TREE|nr:uncharacterized protein MKK02DRAFT_42726 [Dioszegia hungarica]KAI9638340.1 hypothetical protein MKK02DRAFT_42726 [Dioszegia hungarica]